MRNYFKTSGYLTTVPLLPCPLPPAPVPLLPTPPVCSRHYPIPLLPFGNISL
ncbi:hypothetical protein NSP_43280 [Nodularia spumigena CCY9414]|nr:hypothetical protein NSP_43280 [Nodularia spumigena CCY9414]